MAITISDTTPRVQYTATAGQTAFAVNFEFFANADLKVYNGTTLLTYDASPSSASEYSVTGAGVSGGGSITLGSPGATVDDTITIYRDMSIARSTDFPTSGAFQVDSLNEELDKLTAMIQQVETDTKYSPRFSTTTTTGFNLTFPDLVANKVLAVPAGPLTNTMFVLGCRAIRKNSFCFSVQGSWLILIILFIGFSITNSFCIFALFRSLATSLAPRIFRLGAASSLAFICILIYTKIISVIIKNI